MGILAIAGPVLHVQLAIALGNQAFDRAARQLGARIAEELPQPLIRIANQPILVGGNHSNGHGLEQLMEVGQGYAGFLRR